MRILAIATLVCVMLVGCQTKTVEPMVDVTKNPPAELVGGAEAKAADFPEVGWTGGCTATLINPQWAILAAHCKASTSTSVTFTNSSGVKTSYKVAKVFTAPGFRPEAFSLGNDLQLVKFTTPVVGITPATYASATEVPKVGQQLTLVGFGLTGNVTTGANGGAGVKRFGNQEVDYVLAPHILAMVNNGETIAIASGDSGGPAFAKGTKKILGVASGTSVGAGGKIGVTGTYFFHTRLDVHAKWVAETIAKN